MADKFEEVKKLVNEDQNPLAHEAQELFTEDAGLKRRLPKPDGSLLTDKDTLIQGVIKDADVYVHSHPDQAVSAYKLVREFGEAAREADKKGGANLENELQDREAKNIQKFKSILGTDVKTQEEGAYALRKEITDQFTKVLKETFSAIKNDPAKTAEEQETEQFNQGLKILDKKIEAEKNQETKANLVKARSDIYDLMSVRSDTNFSLRQQSDIRVMQNIEAVTLAKLAIAQMKAGKYEAAEETKKLALKAGEQIPNWEKNIELYWKPLKEEEEKNKKEKTPSPTTKTQVTDNSPTLKAMTAWNSLKTEGEQPLKQPLTDAQRNDFQSAIDQTKNDTSQSARIQQIEATLNTDKTAAEATTGVIKPTRKQLTIIDEQALANSDVTALSADELSKVSNVLKSYNDAALDEPLRLGARTFIEDAFKNNAKVKDVLIAALAKKDEIFAIDGVKHRFELEKKALDQVAQDNYLLNSEKHENAVTREFYACALNKNYSSFKDNAQFQATVLRDKELAKQLILEALNLDDKIDAELTKRFRKAAKRILQIDSDDDLDKAIAQASKKV